MICDNKRTETATLLFRFHSQKVHWINRLLCFSFVFFLSVLCQTIFFSPNSYRDWQTNVHPNKWNPHTYFKRYYYEQRFSITTTVCMSLWLPFTCQLHFLWNWNTLQWNSSRCNSIAFDHKFKFVENYTESIRSHFLIWVEKKSMKKYICDLNSICVGLYWHITGYIRE